MEVPTGLVQRTKAMVSSLQLHEAHSRVGGCARHYARQATLSAAAALGPEEMRSALRTHRVANKAKHDWACPKALQDFSDEEVQSMGAECMEEAVVCKGRGLGVSEGV